MPVGTIDWVWKVPQNAGIFKFIRLKAESKRYGAFLITYISLLLLHIYQPRHDKTNKVAVRLAKTQISLGIHPVWSESSLSAWRSLGSSTTHWVHSEDSDQTGQMPRLIWVFTGRTLIVLVLSCCGSYMIMTRCLRMGEGYRLSATCWNWPGYTTPWLPAVLWESKIWSWS